MTGMRLLDVGKLYLLWLLPALLAILIYASRRRRQALQQFAEPALLAQVSNTLNSSARRWKSFLVVAAFALAVVALARPAWNPVEEEVQRRGRDVVFLLDVSRSMLAEDMAPKVDAAKQVADVKLALMADPDVDGSAIDVDADEATRTIHLKGTVPTPAQKTAAERIARGKADGWKIHNMLTVGKKG